VARDRQRSKRRRQRPSGADGGTGAVPARDMGLDDASVEDAGLGSGTPAPDPLKHASAEVDQAHLAEAGSGRGASGDVPDEDSAEYLPAPDAVEGDARRRTRGGLDPSVAEEQSPDRRRQRGRVLAFLGHCIDELRRVQWPDRRQVGQATAVVLGFVVLAGGYLGLMDAIWKPLVNAIL
jgi:preprotein translocase subunit SecE